MDSTIKYERLKSDPEPKLEKKQEPTKFFTIFGVRTEPNEDFQSVFERDFIFRYTDLDINKADIAQAMIGNEMIPTTNKEAVEASGLNGICASIHGMKIRAVTERLTVHKVVTDFECDDETIEILITNANISQHGRDMLKEYRIRF